MIVNLITAIAPLGKTEAENPMSSNIANNILLLGKTGAGKSSLLNALFEKEMAEVGTGKPITPYGIHPYVSLVDNTLTTIYDTQGLECGNYEEWKKFVAEGKKAHGYSAAASDWFHAVIYCLQAPGARLETVDIEVINGCIKDGFSVLVAMTKADLCSSEDENKLKYEILENCPDIREKDIVSICSKEQNVRGIQHVIFGVDELKTILHDLSRKTILSLLPKRIVLLTQKQLLSSINQLRKKYTGILVDASFKKNTIADIDNQCNDSSVNIEEKQMSLTLLGFSYATSITQGALGCYKGCKDICRNLENIITSITKECFKECGFQKQSPNIILQRFGLLQIFLEQIPQDELSSHTRISLEMTKIFPFTGGFLGELLRQHISFLTGQILYNIKRDHKFSCQEDFFKFFQGRLFRYVECLEDTIRAQIEIAIE